MAPNAEDRETARLNADYNVSTHQSCRVLPDQTAPAQAWTETEDPGGKSPGENRRLLPTAPHKQKHKSHLQAGLTLGVHSDYPQKPLAQKQHKTRFQKRKEKLIEALKPPYFILSMIIIMVGIHFFGNDEFRARLEWLPSSWRHEPWRLLTYGVVHASPAHLALNALVALAVGWRLEREQGWWRVVCVWVGGVAAGALGAGLLQPTVKVVGASAAVYALLTAHLPNVCIRFGHIPLWWFRPLSVVVLCASEGCWALVRSRGAGGHTSGHAGAGGSAETPNEHVAWAAHVLGAVVGVPLAFVVFTGENNRKTYVIAARIVSGISLLTGTALATARYTLWVHGT